MDEKGRKGRREIVRRVMKVWEWEIREKERVGLCGIVGEGLERESLLGRKWRSERRGSMERERKE